MEVEGEMHSRVAHRQPGNHHIVTETSVVKEVAFDTFCSSLVDKSGEATQFVAQKKEGIYSELILGQGSLQEWFDEVGV